MSVTSGPLAVNTANLLACGAVGQSYASVVLQAVGGTPPYTWSILSGNWPDAEAFAQSVCGNLVTLQDRAEENWLSGTFTNRFWIGLFRDPGSDPKFSTGKWASGSSSEYRHWNPGNPETPEPNNANGDEYYAAVDAGYWVDSPSGVENPGYQRFGIVELLVPSEGVTVFSEVPDRADVVRAADIGSETSIKTERHTN